MNRKPRAIRKASQYSQPSFLSREAFIKVFYPRLTDWFVGEPHPCLENMPGALKNFLRVSAALWQKLWHFVNGRVSLLKNGLQKTIEFVFAHLICTSLKISNIHIANVITFDDLLGSYPVVCGI